MKSTTLAMWRKVMSRLDQRGQQAVLLRVAASMLAMAIMGIQAVRHCQAADEEKPQVEKTDALGDPLPEGARLRLGTLRFRHPSSVVDLALALDEKTIVSIGGWVIAWDTATGKQRWKASAPEHGLDLPGAAYGIRGLAFFGDGKQFYTPGREHEAVAWDLDTGRQDAPPPGPQGRSRAIDVTAD